MLKSILVNYQVFKRVVREKESNAFDECANEKKNKFMTVNLYIYYTVQLQYIKNDLRVDNP